MADLSGSLLVICGNEETHQATNMWPFCAPLVIFLPNAGF
jgi:hypothetical protein